MMIHVCVETAALMRAALSARPPATHHWRTAACTAAGRTSQSLSTAVEDAGTGTPSVPRVDVGVVALVSILVSAFARRLGMHRADTDAENWS